MTAKTLDKQGRWRNLTIAFRVSPEENELIDRQVRLYGISKQEYLTNNMLHEKIVVKGNPKVFKTLKSEMDRIIKQLYRIRDGNKLTKEQLELILTITKLYIKLMNLDDNSINNATATKQEN